MISRTHILSSPLSEFIASFFYYRDYRVEHSMDRLLPDGNVEMIIDLTDSPKYIYDNETLKGIQACRGIWFSGLRTRPITIPSGNHSEMVVVTFRRGGAYPFLHEPLDVLKDTVVDADLVMPRELSDLRERMRDEPKPEAKLQILEDGFLQLFRCRLEPNPFVRHMITHLTAEPTTTKLAELAHEVGYSHKHMISIFRRHVGVNPKSYLRILRFQKAVNEIGLAGDIDWLSLVHDCGFYDQSHLSGEFRRFTGLSPSDYLRQRGRLLNYLPVVETR